MLALEVVHDKIVQVRRIQDAFLCDLARLDEKVVLPFRLLDVHPIKDEEWTFYGKFSATSYGKQFYCESAVRDRRSSVYFRKFVASSSELKGLGDKKAQALWEIFGDELFDVLDTKNVELIKEAAPFLSNYLILKLIELWSEKDVESALIRYLSELGLPIYLHKKLTAIYGDHSLELLKENPYVLCAFIAFKKVDAIANRMGISPDDRKRLTAAVESVFYASWDAGNTAIRRKYIAPHLSKILNIDIVEAESIANDVVASHWGIKGFTNGSEDICQLAPIYEMEQYVFAMFKQSMEENIQGSLFDQKCILEALSEFELENDVLLAPEQRKAVLEAYRLNWSVICGGAGTGKTTVLKAVYHVMGSDTPIIQLAFTGKAARRMSESTGRDAITIAKFLQEPETYQSFKNALIVLDEAGMIDISTMARLLRLLPKGARLLVVGDDEQLAPIGPGLVFHVLLHAFPEIVTELKSVQRSKTAALLTSTVKSVRAGEFVTLPSFDTFSELRDDIGIVSYPDEQFLENLYALHNDAVKKYGNNVQILCPVKAGLYGKNAINQYFHNRAVERAARHQSYLPGEPIIWLINDYERGVMNGTLGTITSVDVSLGLIKVDFEGQIIELGPDDKESFDHAYAVTVHKSQGSEFDVAIIPIKPSKILDKSMLYTALTRAKKLAMVVGDMATVNDAIAVGNASKRRTLGVAYFEDSGHG